MSKNYMVTGGVERSGRHGSAKKAQAQSKKSFEERRDMFFENHGFEQSRNELNDLKAAYAQWVAAGYNGLDLKRKLVKLGFESTVSDDAKTEKTVRIIKPGFEDIMPDGYEARVLV
ncbi:MAG: hypothetical protein U9Q15_01015 [Patescibacteria group bacterium]|nr:hypothetical protein [Patescibacteria group bacterium]